MKVISGDLLNQIVASNYAASKVDLPFLGIYNACASSVEGLIIASNMIEANQVNNVIVEVSSHNNTAEKQFRYPVEYGGPKPKTMTFTATGSAGALLSKNKKGIIEGGHLMHMKNISDFKGTVIVKRTARIKCYLRASLRDYRNPVWRKGLNKWGLIKRFFHCYKRRFHHIFKQNYVEQFIIKLEQYNK